MKTFHCILFSMLIGISASFLQSCKKDDPASPEVYGAVKFQVEANASGVPFSIGKNIVDLNHQKYDISRLMFYIGDISLIAEDGTSVPLKDIVLVDYSDPISPPFDPNSIGTAFSFKVKKGKYKGITYGLGVPERLNGVKNGTFNPAQYPNEHPLSAYRGTDWSWAGYRFLMLEGNSYDSSNTAYTMEYHVATDEFYTPAAHTLSLDVEKGDTTTLVMSLDVNKLFFNGAGDPDNIDIIKENFTHSSGSDQQIELAHKLMRNLVKAFQPKQ